LALWRTDARWGSRRPASTPGCPAFEKHISELELALELWPPEAWDSAALLASEGSATAAYAAGLRLSRRGTAMATRLDLPTTDDLAWLIRHRGERPRGTFHLQALAEARSLPERLGVLRRSLLPQRPWLIQQHPWARHSADRGVRRTTRDGARVGRPRVGGSPAAPSATTRHCDYAWTQVPMSLPLSVQHWGLDVSALIGLPLQQGTQVVLVELGMHVGKSPRAFGG
jgi:hypothetical protein